eukprot:COSAG01_NODE_72353_length_253_cov_0.675325_1_plen_43_part_10
MFVCAAPSARPLALTLRVLATAFDKSQAMQEILDAQQVKLRRT